MKYEIWIKSFAGFSPGNSQDIYISCSNSLQITEIDRERRRLLVSLKSCDCYPDQSEETKDKSDKRGVDLLVDYIKERDEILERLRTRSSELNVIWSLI